MLVRMFFLVMSVPLMLCGAIAQGLGPSAIPYELRNIFPVSWAVENPATAFFAAAVTFVVALLVRPGRAVLVNDFKN